MNSRCEEFRTLIEQSLSSDLSAEEILLLKEHLRECDGCRRYLEELESDDILLRGYAGLFNDSASETAEMTVAALARNSSTSASTWRNIFMRPKFVLTAAAAAILIAVAIYSISIRTSTPSFARVLEAMDEARDVSFTSTFDVEGMDPFSNENVVNSEGILRSDWENGDFSIRDHVNGVSFSICNSIKVATTTITKRNEGEKKLSNFLDWISTFHHTPAEYAGKEIVNGIETDFYRSEDDPYYIKRAWVDPKTDLPVKVALIHTPNPDSDIISPKLSVHAAPFGGSGISRALGYSSSGGITIDATMTLDNLVWNSDPDDSLFDMTPPEGFTTNFDTSDATYVGEENLISSLELWTEMADGIFPEDINDLSSTELVAPMLVKTFDGDGDPDEEFDEAVKAANVLLKGCLFAQEMKVIKSWSYVGKDVTLGEKDVPVCWWKEGDSDKYRIIYGDLRVEDIEEKDLPRRQPE